MSEDRRAALVTQAQRMDDDTLTHLSNRGLVRRARKIASNGSPMDVDDTGLVVTVGDQPVRFAWGTPLTDGVCVCATAGVCQHLLGAVMVLRDSVPALEHTGESDDPSAAPQGDAPSRGAGDIRAALVAAGDDELRAWARKADHRWAVERIESIDPATVVIAEGVNLSVRLPAPHGDVLFLGPSFDDAIVKPSTRNDRRIVALAVVALWLEQGRQPVPLEVDAARPTELVSERSAVTERAIRIAADLCNVGLLHLADAERERLDSLAASARGVKLYRLSRLAERAADQVAALGELSSAADTAALLALLAEMAAVSEAIDRRLVEGRTLPEGLCGAARTAYQAVGQLELVGLGHYSWGDRRFAGTTAVLGQAHDRIYSVVQPSVVNGRALGNAIGWSGLTAVTGGTGCCLTLSNAQANDELRLSGSEKTTATLIRALTADDLRALAWTGARPASPSRLLGRSASPWVVLQVESQATPIAFDPIGQRAEWTLRACGQDVELGLPYRSSAPEATAALESIAAQGVPDFVVGRLRLSHGALVLWPISLMVDGELVNLADGGEGATDAAAPDPAEKPGGRHLEQLEARVIAVAERGNRPGREAALAEVAHRADDWGFSVLAKVIRSTPTDAPAVLRASWVLGILSDLHDSAAVTSS